MPAICTSCNKRFNSLEAMLQHRRDSSCQIGSPNCESCNRDFDSLESLKQHLRNSHHHNKKPYCKDCSRYFGSSKSLQQHRESNNREASSMAFVCEPSKANFKTQDALEQHKKDSPRHKDHYCDVCKRSFSRADSLEAHLRDSSAHNLKTPATKTNQVQKTVDKTPLDRFFLSFPSFDHVPSLSPATSYKLLRKHMAWSKDSADEERASRKYKEALVDEVKVWFGNQNDLTAWHTLFRAIGIEQPPDSIAACKAVARTTHVNIVDLIEWGRGDRSDDGGVKLFPNVQALRRYTIKTKKFFPRSAVKNEKGEKNIVLRHLLRKFFMGNTGRDKASAVMIAASV
ncbi:zinc-finger double-stranded RNA-binding domain-protein [Podospora aff. communis PSN243]|uniref:Zinc-finger double-stranded RNA-binding domain-protein n=1 Tax=Podospora aff. communis PSN243 TaxID=3040156 RepID=A0AAV9G256_9PEZI|nr:zinc-finger double-stranded RNA-binding domain-protein [Podospora aff. communis PSN243]